ncbi:MAG TPA: hypothetical protein VFT66_26615 [Roseiflexaceae bacterium]|jgi:hypothetical protein|nr:hypothetical protein [Roseiflexaceae bacterium]
MFRPPKFGRGPRIKVAVERHTGLFHKGIVVQITNCDPGEPLEVLFYAERQQLHTMTVTANHNGEADISLNWNPTADGKVRVRSAANNDTTEVGF